MRNIITYRVQRKIFIGTVIIMLYLLFGWLRLYPIAQTFVLSLREFDLIGLKDRFIGLQNYIQLFKDESFITAAKNTFLIALITVPASLGIGLTLALVYNAKIKFSSIFQLIYFIPVIMPTVAVALIWRWMYDPEFGLLNYILTCIGLRRIPWLVDPDIALYSVMILWIWKWVGYYAILWLVGLQNIPRIYNEAAQVDGASSWQVFRFITLPLLRPIALFLIIICTSWAFKIFVPVYVLTIGSQGAPGRAVRVIVYDMYENFFIYFKVGYATAEAFILFSIVALLTLIQLKLLKVKG